MQKETGTISNANLFFRVSKVLALVKKLIPVKLFNSLQPYYHWSLALVGAIIYRFPSRNIKVVAITGTKGKTTTTELVSAVLEAGGYKTSIVSTLRFKIGQHTEKNPFKMTMPGRLFLQKFIRKAVSAKCDYLILELSSEGAKLHRHAFIALDALIFTNLAPEHIESHGGYENYVNAKLSIAKALEKSSKKKKVIVVNDDDTESTKFLVYNIENKITYSLSNAEPYGQTEEGEKITLGQRTIQTKLSGDFNIYNMLAAAAYARTQHVREDKICSALENFTGVPGRMQKIYGSDKTNQNFDVVVDYAHTADSLKAAYSVYAGKRKLICVLGATGGGRDKWKRPAMGKVASDYCDEIILTNDDPYDEDPDQIVCEMATGIERNYDIIINRREAIREAVRRASEGDVVMLTGKGTDPYLMEANGKKTPWSDANFAKEEIDNKLSKKTA